MNIYKIISYFKNQLCMFSQIMNHSFQGRGMGKKLFVEQEVTQLCYLPVTQQQNFIRSTPILNTNRHKTTQNINFQWRMLIKIPHRFFLLEEM